MGEQNPTNTNNDNNPNNGGENTPNWYENMGIDASLLTDKIKGFKDANAFAKSFNEAQSFIGKGIPDDNTPENIRNEFYTKLGRPESADKYTWTPPEGLTVEGANADNFKAFKQRCFEAGMTDKQVSAVMGGWSEIITTINKSRTDELASIAADAKATLSAQNEWGDKYDERLSAVMERIDKLGIKQQLADAGVLYDKNVLKAVDEIISDAKESKIKGADGKYISPTERLAQLKSNPAYYQAAHPDHASVIAEANSIYAEMANAK